MRKSNGTVVQTRPSKVAYGAVDVTRVARFLRNEHPVKPEHCVEALTQIPAGTVKKWLLEKAQPNGPAVFALIQVYGRALLLFVFDGAIPEGLDRTHRADRQHQLQERAADLHREMQTL